MKIMFLNGGLANQMFQYTFYRFGQLMNPKEEWYLDDSFFFVNSVHNGYELNKVFGIKPNLLSEYFDGDVWDYMIELKKQGSSVPQILLENEIDIRMISEYDNWKQWNPFKGQLDQLDGRFEEWMAVMKGDVYYNGYAIEDGFFNKIRDVLLTEFTFPMIEDAANLQYLKEIGESNSCSLHVRRGDFLAMGMAGTDEKYSEMIDEMLSNDPDVVMFVFSDDIPYCEAHREAMGLNKPKKTVFVKGNEGKNAFRDMQLMSRCKNMIVGNSSFSYMASLLNDGSGNILVYRQS